MSDYASGVREAVEGAQDAMSARRVFGEPYEKDGITVIPAAQVWGGAGGGGGGDAEAGGGLGTGFGLFARPVGAFLIRDGEVTWQPALDVTRVVVGAQVVAIVGILAIRTIVKARAKTRRRLG
jgi:uncharacterized spore protein YtfJ